MKRRERDERVFKQRLKDEWRKHWRMILERVVKRERQGGNGGRAIQKMN